MTDVEQRALAQIVNTPRGRVVLTFLKELATAHAMAAMNSETADLSFAMSQRAKGVMDAHQQLEALTDTGDYARTYATES